jgi:Na+-driven multidrug efflux pump
VQSSLAVDVTHGRLSSHIWRLAWPITTSVALLYLPGIYDTVWLGRLGSAAQAAAGVTMSVRFAMISVLMALSTGGGAVVARYVGAKDQASANLATLQAIMLMTVASGSLGVVGVIFARPLMSLGGADAATLPLAVRYARIIFGGLIPMELVPSIGFMLSAAGAPQVILSMALFSNDTETIEIGVYVLRVLSVGQLAFLMN